MRIVAFMTCAILALVALPNTPAAHDMWINRGEYVSKNGVHCCGDQDCAIMDKGSVKYSKADGGWRIQGYGTITWMDPQTMEMRSIREYYDEVVPLNDTQVSEDGDFWRCKMGKNNLARRCFFAPGNGV